MKKFNEYKKINFPRMEEEILKFWKEKNIFKKSIESRKNSPVFTFYEGPPTANNMPGVHHVMARTIKDLFCRYKTLKGFKVERKGGWDTHGLPVEIEVEKELGIEGREQIIKYGIEKYNEKCRTNVMKYKSAWEKLTERMGYWVDMEHPYITFDKKYIETVWHLLKQLYEKKLLYKGYKIQPYCPKCGTSLSSHELGQPGAYKDVKDPSLVARFKVKEEGNTYLLAWTTTPWTLPSNVALAIGEKISYVKVKTQSPYTNEDFFGILAKEQLGEIFEKHKIPYEIAEEIPAKKLLGMQYEQLLNYLKPDKPAFHVIAGDFVSTEEGTGIVHMAPAFGADDFRAGQENNLPMLNPVDRQGKFFGLEKDINGKFVKDADVELLVKLKKEGKLLFSEKYEHSYPHCWRHDSPLIYYPVESWFIRTTAVKDKMTELNKTIHWKPEGTGSGRFGTWLENNVDWSLSRSRFWGTPLPIWKTEDGKHYKCIGSENELNQEIKKSMAKGFIPKEFALKDFHRPHVDEVILVCGENGEKMFREPELIDVWFDSGSMPYAQWHYPFENKEKFKENFPADFIAEGVDQTRGWFYTLHAIAVMLFDSVAYKNVIANGLVLDKKGLKMSKRLKNYLDPFDVIKNFGADATRWYMMENAPPWENLKFDTDGVAEVQRKFFGTLTNTHGFFSLYANIDGFDYSESEIPFAERPEIDRWILSLLNSLVKKTEEYMNDYDPTKATREIQYFTIEQLSNWYVRLSRRRFWSARTPSEKGEKNTDKISAYQTLYTCLITLAKLISPIAPFYSDKLYRDLNEVVKKENGESVHLAEFPKVNPSVIDELLEERMDLAQRISSMVRGLRKKANLRIRQPLKKILIPVSDDIGKNQLERVRHLILSEVNVKELQYVSEDSEILVKQVKPNFRILGPKAGAWMKELTQVIGKLERKNILQLEKGENVTLDVSGKNFTLAPEDVEIVSKDIVGWRVMNDGKITVALDISMDEALKAEGIARELVNRIQTFRKDLGFEVTDRIKISFHTNPKLDNAINQFKEYICSETLAVSLEITEESNGKNGLQFEIDDVKGKLFIQKK